MIRWLEQNADCLVRGLRAFCGIRCRVCFYDEEVRAFVELVVGLGRTLFSSVAGAMQKSVYYQQKEWVGGCDECENELRMQNSSVP